MFVAWGSELGFLYNDAYAEILEAKHPAAIGRRFQDIWAEIWDDIHPIIAQAMQGISTYHRNLPLTMNRNGYEEQTWFTFSYSPVREESGKVAGMFCAVTETTDQMLAERHRAEEHERLRNLFQQAPGFIAVLRGPLHIFDIANDAYLRLVGHRDILGKPVREALPELEGQHFFEHLDQVYATGEPFFGKELPAMLQRQANGPLEQRFVSFIYQPTVDHRGIISGIFVEGSDVTEGVQAHRALKESEQRLRQLANTIPQLAWMADPDGRVHWYNDRCYEYTGLRPEELRGWGWQRAHHPDAVPSVSEKWKRSIESGQPFEMSFPLRAANGEYHSFFTRAAPLRDAAGNIVQWFGTSTDITPLELAKNELKEANRRKDEFLAMLAHELRNPLAPISTAAELLKLSASDEGRVRKTSDIITRQVKHMTGLVDDLLDVSRVTRGLVTLHDETLSINGLLTEAIEQVHGIMETKRHHFSVDFPEEPVFVRGDRTRLIQVFANILNNAAKYTPAEGRITLYLGADAEHVEVAVIDNGAGIAPTLLPYIFELFTQAERSADRAQGGLGLGLALAKSLVELQGGTVSAQSRGLGNGSTFTVRLPRVSRPDSDTAQQNVRSGLPHQSGKAKVLIVDDNRDAAEMLSLLLESLGHEVEIAYRPHDALSAAQRSAPSALFLDIGLPDMDGYELARRIRALPETSKSLIVAVTGYGQPKDRERAMRAGFDYHLVKPAALNDVLDVLTKLKPQ